MKRRSVPAGEGPTPHPKGRSSGTLRIAILIIAIISVAVFSEVLSYYYPSGTSSNAYLVTIQIPDGAAGNKSMSFSPPIVTVILGINNTVQWIDLDKTPNALYTVVFTQVPAGVNASSLSSYPASSGIRYDIYYGPILLPAPGIYLYHCYFHPWMTGKIVVKA